MSNRNTIFLLSSLFIVIISTSLLVRFNDKKADYAPPTFISDSDNHNETITAADQAYGNKDFIKALSLYKQVLESYPDNFPLIHKIGKIQIQLRRFQEAQNNYAYLTQKAPDNVIFQASLALTSLEVKDYEQAFKSSNQAILLKSKDGLPYLVKAAIFAHRGQVEECLEQFSKISPTPFLLLFLKRPEFDTIRQDKSFLAFTKRLDELFPSKDK